MCFFMETENTSEKTTRVSKNLSKPLPDGRVSLEKHFIVFKYMFRNGNKLLSAKEVGPNTKINATMVSGIFGFFYKIGLLNREKNKYSLKDEFNEAIKNLAWNKTDEAKKLLREIYLDCWFGVFIKEKSKLAPTISKEHLMSDVGLECGADPSYHGKAILRLVEFMEDAELIIYSAEDKSYSFNVDNENYEIQNNQNKQGQIETNTNNQYINSEQSNHSHKLLSTVNEQEFYTITVNGFGKTETHHIEHIDDLEVFEVIKNKIKRNLESINSKDEQ